LRSERRLGRSTAVLLALALGAAAAPAAPPGPTAEEVKAAYLVNFLRYTEWPAARFPRPDSPYVVCLVGADAVAEELEKISRRVGAVDGRPLEVRRLPLVVPESAHRAALAADLAGAHVVYFGEEVEEVPELLAGLEHAAVLTVGDQPDFAAEGGMIGLRRDGDRVVFDANPEAIRSTPISVSARVLRLARIVEREVP
jgi:hypothetical protein